MVNLARKPKGNMILMTMIRTICLLYPEQLRFVTNITNKQKFVISETNVMPLLEAIQRAQAVPSEDGTHMLRPNLRAYIQHARPSKSDSSVMLPMRIIFKAPFIQITYESEHTNAEGREYAGRLIYQFFDSASYEKTEEMVCLIFPYEGNGKNLARPKVRTTRAFEAFETGSLETFQALQQFLFVLMHETKTAELLKLLVDDIITSYEEGDELPRHLKRLYGLIYTPAPAFDFSNF